LVFGRQNSYICRVGFTDLSAGIFFPVLTAEYKVAAGFSPHFSSSDHCAP